MTDLSKEFVQYHADNPDMYQEYERFAKLLEKTNPSKLAINLISERVRWESIVRGTGEFKVQNSFRPYYSRLLVWNNPRWAGKFGMHRIPIDGQADLTKPHTWNQAYWSQF